MRRGSASSDDPSVLLKDESGELTLRCRCVIFTCCVFLHRRNSMPPATAISISSACHLSEHAPRNEPGNLRGLFTRSMRANSGNELSA